MDVTSPVTATLGVWTIARFAALAVLATEALFLYTRRSEAQTMRGAMEGEHDARLLRGDHVPGVSRIFWALTPALILLGLCFWCTVSV
jgi:hypothetical protein